MISPYRINDKKKFPKKLKKNLSKRPFWKKIIYYFLILISNPLKRQKSPICGCKYGKPTRKKFLYNYKDRNIRCPICKRSWRIIQM